MEFMNAIKNTLSNETSITENGAVGYKTTGKELLDLNFAVASLRDMSDDEIARRFMLAFCEDKILAMKWLFYARDVRQGLGERRLFRVVLENLVKSNPEMVIPVINMIPEYGRFDDMWCMLDHPETAVKVYQIVDAQLTQDFKNMLANKPISLLAKWMPSINASSPKTKAYGKHLAKALRLTEREYRKTLSKLRKHLDVVEVKMSDKNWSEIKYEAVPSRANLIYNKAFLRNDEDRRREFLGQLEKGETKINASTLFPHDIVNKYTGGLTYGMSSKDATIEGLWKALPDTVKGCGNTIVVADGSGSMETRVDPKSSVSALDVANALAIYFAEHSSGQFKDKYITFSERPQFVDFSHCNSLHAKLQTARAHNEVANTNIESVFDMILSTAINNRMSQDDLPANILIISDMEFDRCAVGGYGETYVDYWGRRVSRPISPNKTLFNTISRKYTAAGYKMPRLVFWNVASRTGTIPVKENDLGVALVSGFSVNVAKMVMSGKTDPFECLLETLNSKRYDPIELALKG